ncbi:Serine/threonine-protein kinase PknD [Symmachiella macrocystis]|uniref:Serine/threonine-protein kinase PknD n=1 Tax=Symmachiella macrocystis TaxID=2527985 RepID=A0A5C6AZI0_9PLAN|nr:Serine/threonine-protein kinase PknD [Symmachiella macrocystis]
MASMHDSKFLDNPKFVSRLVACIESLQQGEPFDRDSLCRDFPEYAADVDEFLHGQKDLNKLVTDLGRLSGDPSVEKTVGADGSIDEYRIGETIRFIGEYELLQEVARGGMGIVFKARQQSLNRIVALKMILAGRLADASEVERFQREAQVASRIKHPHIVPIHEIGQHEGRHYFTMDFVEGKSLAE